jgi:hypothetical protein
VEARMNRRPYVIYNHGGRVTRSLMTKALKAAGFASLKGMSDKQLVADERPTYVYHVQEDIENSGYGRTVRWEGYANDEEMQSLMNVFTAVTERDPRERKFIDVYHD